MPRAFAAGIGRCRSGLSGHKVKPTSVVLIGIYASNCNDHVPAQIMDEIQAGLRYMFQTESKYTCLVTGSGAQHVP